MSDKGNIFWAGDLIWSAGVAFYRSMLRHPLYAALNLLGLAFGIAVFITVSLFVRFETSYERWLPQADRIYEVGRSLRLSPTEMLDITYATPGSTMDIIHKDYPDLVGTRVANAYSYVGTGDKVAEEEGQLVDRDFFKVFKIELVDGRVETALDADSIFLSESMAGKYFGRTDIVGQTLILRENGNSGAAVRPLRHTYTIRGVMKDMPANSSLKFTLVRLWSPELVARNLFWDSWMQESGRTFVVFDTPAQAAGFNRQIDHIVDQSPPNLTNTAYFGGRPPHETVRARAVPLVSEHLSQGSARHGVLAAAICGTLALITALVNYVNLATARARLRAREIAVRKALGAAVTVVRVQFLIEAVLVTAAAGLLGLSLTEGGLPLINHICDLRLHLDYEGDVTFLASLGLGIVLTGFLAGLYPAYVMSEIQPVRVLAGAGSVGAGRWGRRIRELLVVVQFGVAGALLIILTGFAVQVRHMEASDLGFHRNGLLMTESLISSELSVQQISAIHDAWRTLPNVVAVSTGTVPGLYFVPARPIVTAEPPDKTEFPAMGAIITRDYFKVFDADILAGRVVSDGDYVPFDHMPEVVNVDINEAAARALGCRTPQMALGRFLQRQGQRLKVVGVVSDQRFGPPTQSRGPQIYLPSLGALTKATTVVRYDHLGESVMRARLAAAWHRLAPELPLALRSGAEAMEPYYHQDRHNTNLFAVTALASALIGMIGLYGVAAFSTSSRFVEIALRKTMGATSWQVARLLVWQFVRPVLLANLVAWPIAWLVLSRWLSQFDDRIALTPLYFLAGSGVSLLIAVATVGGLALASASVSPGKALRHE